MELNCEYKNKSSNVTWPSIRNMKEAQGYVGNIYIFGGQNFELPQSNTS